MSWLEGVNVAWPPVTLTVLAWAIVAASASIEIAATPTRAALRMPPSG